LNSDDESSAIFYFLINYGVQFVKLGFADVY
jgi:hypothetical protein